MTFQELAKNRYSVRSFKDTPIEEEKLNLILEAGRVAPTACNNQPQKIYVAKSAEARQKLASVCRCTFDAPVILVVCYDRTRNWKNKLMPGLESGETDAAIAEKLYLSVRTVKQHIQSMRDKTGFRNRTELAVRARESGLVINDKTE
jgi:nitroreductase